MLYDTFPIQFENHGAFVHPFNAYRPSHGMNAISSVRRVVQRAAEQLAELDIIPSIRRWYATKASGERSSLWDTPAGETGYGKSPSTQLVPQSLLDNGGHWPVNCCFLAEQKLVISESLTSVVHARFYKRPRRIVGWGQSLPGIAISGGTGRQMVVSWRHYTVSYRRKLHCTRWSIHAVHDTQKTLANINATPRKHRRSPLQQIRQKNSFVDGSLAGVPGSEPGFDKVPPPPHADTANYAQSRTCWMR